MRPPDRLPRLLPVLALGIVLVAAHIAAAVHGFDHDPAGAQAKPCALCITAAQLGSACVDSGSPTEIEAAGYRFEGDVPVVFASLKRLPPRQRAPPPPNFV